MQNFSVFLTLFQSTRLREARHQPQGLILTDELISIHAPAGGATKSLRVAQSQYDISIHAPAGGATSPFVDSTRVFDISIHAPAGGATFEQRNYI